MKVEIASAVQARRQVGRTSARHASFTIVVATIIDVVVQYVVEKVEELMI
jgi:hypothetical protein